MHTEVPLCKIRRQTEKPCTRLDFSSFSSFHSQFVGVFWNLSTDLLSVVEEFAEHKVSDYVLKRRSMPSRFSEYILSYSNLIGWFVKLMKSSIISLQLSSLTSPSFQSQIKASLLFSEEKPQTQQFLPPVTPRKKFHLCADSRIYHLPGFLLPY